MGAEEKAIRILKVLSQKPYEYGITELSEKIGYSKGGVHKLVSVLLEEGMVRQLPDKRYTLGVGAYIMGLAYEAGGGMGDIIKPVLRGLRDETNENALFAIWNDDKVIMLYREESREVIRVTGTTGSERPLNASAVGKLLGAYADRALLEKNLAEKPLQKYTDKSVATKEELFAMYEDVRKQGYAISSEEFTKGSWGVAAPVRNAQGSVWAAVSIAAPLMRMDQERKEYFIRAVQEAANEITKQMRF